MVFRFNRGNHNDQGWSVTDREHKIQEIEAKIRAEEEIKSIEEEAFRLWKADERPEGKEDDYRRLAIHKIKGKNLLLRIEKEASFLWEADGKPEGKEEYYWRLAIDKIRKNNIPAIYQPYYLLEKRVLQPVYAWIEEQALFKILLLIAGIIAVIPFVEYFIDDGKRNNDVITAWQTITIAGGQTGSGGRIEALEYLNSYPLRFPGLIWIKKTKEDWFWDKKEQRCKIKSLLGRRWERQPLVGLSAPKAYLANIHLCGADLRNANLEGAYLGNANLEGAVLLFANLQEVFLHSANLQEADLWGANLEEAVLVQANLQEASLVYIKNLTAKQIKSACFWEEAIYKGEWNDEKEAWIATEPDNTKFIEGLKEDKLSEPKYPVNCSIWEKQ